MNHIITLLAVISHCDDLRRVKMMPGFAVSVQTHVSCSGVYLRDLSEVWSDYCPAYRLVVFEMMSDSHEEAGVCEGAAVPCLSCRCQ